ncbi:MAG: PASTA domain-containing protein [Bacteroidales bacterium]|nr:PASTA domain-containing protein [Bacteroidales bacterium]
MSLKNFLLSKIFLKNLVLAVVIAIGLIILLLVSLNFYTRHGQARPVPDFTGLNLDEVAQLARKNRLKFVVIDSVYTSNVPRGYIAEQNPQPGFKVKKWRNIILTINAFHPEMVAMPDLVDLPKRQALALIESSGLKMGELRYIPDLSVDVVLRQLLNEREIAAGDSLQKGSVIDLILGKGLSNLRTPVPNLSGMTLEPARNRILGASLNLRTFIYDNTIRSGSDSVKAFVYRQNPEFREDLTLQLGSDIYLWLTIDSAKLPGEPGMMLPDTIPGIELPEL